MNFSKDVLEELAEDVFRQQTFECSTFEEAKASVKIKGAEFVFDRLSLCYYKHNLDSESYWYFGKVLTQKWKAVHSPEDIKARVEYGVLFQLCRVAPEYANMSVSKEKRPDFVLKGNRVVGIEVTELTTPYDKVLTAISRENFGKGLTADQVKENAMNKHGQKADEYEYITINGSAAIGSGMFECHDKKMEYAREIIKKHQKYSDMYGAFDEFVILCNAQEPVSVTSETDTYDIIEYAKSLDRSIGGCTVCILYIDERDELSVKKYSL